MDNFIVILVLGLTAQVKSDVVDVGYRYKVPATSYDVPFGSVGSLINNDRKYYHIEKQPFPTGNIVPVSPVSRLQTPIHEHTSFIGGQDGSQQQVFSATSGSNIDLLNNLPSSPNKQGISTFNLLENSLNRNPSNTENVLDSRANFASQNSQQVEVQRHLYFYAAPDEPEEVRPRILAPVGPIKKDVKILFIKTPTFNTGAVNIPVQPQNEEKTLVYVLVKKPDESSFVIPTAAPTKPSKPEVYFIKYNSQKEAQDAIANIQQGSTSSGISVNSDIYSRNSFSNDEKTVPSQLTDGNQNINLVSTISSTPRNTGGEISYETPTVISTTSTPTSGDETVNLHLKTGFDKIDSRFLPVSPTESDSGRISSSDTSINIGGSFNEGGQETDGSSTVSSVNLPTVASRTSGEINVHQVYGPPRNRR